MTAIMDFQPNKFATTLAEIQERKTQICDHLQALIVDAQANPALSGSRNGFQARLVEELGNTISDLESLCAEVESLSNVRYGVVIPAYMIERDRIGPPLEQDATDEAIAAVIADLRANWRVEHPTKYEEILLTFQAAGGQGVSIEQLRYLFDDSQRPENAVTTALLRLNKKLAPFGLRIARPTEYHIFPIAVED